MDGVADNKQHPIVRSSRARLAAAANVSAMRFSRLGVVVFRQAAAPTSVHEALPMHLHPSTIVYSILAIAVAGVSQFGDSSAAAPI